MSWILCVSSTHFVFNLAAVGLRFLSSQQDFVGFPLCALNPDLRLHRFLGLWAFWCFRWVCLVSGGITCKWAPPISTFGTRFTVGGSRSRSPPTRVFRSVEGFSATHGVWDLGSEFVKVFHRWRFRPPLIQVLNFFVGNFTVV